jgi:hypothetical protein
MIMSKSKPMGTEASLSADGRLTALLETEGPR